MDVIAAGFAEGLTALAVAAAAGLNPKTVQLYYGRMRELLAADREALLTERYGMARVSPDLFTAVASGTGWQNCVPVGCLVVRDKEIELLFVNDGPDGPSDGIDPSVVAGWLVAADQNAKEGCHLEKINCLPTGKSGGERARAFWIAAKRRLTAYHGGCRQHFHLYLREMEFRENMESRSVAREHLAALLARNTITVTGENDA